MYSGNNIGLTIYFDERLNDEILYKVKLELYEKELNDNKFIEEKEFEV